MINKKKHIKTIKEQITVAKRNIDSVVMATFFFYVTLLALSFLTI